PPAPPVTSTTLPCSPVSTRDGRCSATLCPQT
ncbi:uncharacterized protein METZ01_LOCUS402327, partial [marine metagenome]